MRNCPPDDQFSVCEVRQQAGGSYTYVLGAAEKTKVEPSASRFPVSRGMEVSKMGKDSGSIILNLEVKLRKLQTAGVPYATINRYFRSSISDETTIGLFNLKDLLTYNPRSDPPKDYSDAYTAISQFPSGIDVSTLFSIVDGMPKV